jgi:hypothetical protein
VVTLEDAEVRGDDVLKIESVSGDVELIPGQRNIGSLTNLMVYDQVRTAGHYRVKAKDKIIAGLAFNYDRRESILSFQSSDDLAEGIEREGLKGFSILDENIRTLKDSIQDINQGKRLWKLFIIFALFFLAIEVFLLRVWSKN